MKNISKRGLEYQNDSRSLEGLWLKSDKSLGFLTIQAKDKFTNFEAVLTLAEAKALRTLLDFEINELERNAK